MRKTLESRWIEQAEARAVLEQVRLHRATSEPHVVITYTRARPAGFDWRRHLPRVLRRTVAAIRSLPVDAIVRVNSCSLAAPSHPAAELDENDLGYGRLDETAGRDG